MATKTGRPKGQKNIRKAPEILDEVGAKHWDELCITVKTVKGDISDSDYYLMEKACIAHSMGYEAYMAVKEGGQWYETSSGQMKQHPSVAVVKDSMKEYKSILAEMMITAKSARVTERINKEAEEKTSTPLSKMASFMAKN